MTSEACLIGCCILEPELLDKAVAAGIAPDTFPDHKQAALWRTLVHQRASGRGLDMVSVAMEMKDAMPMETFMEAERAAPTAIGFEQALEAVVWDKKARKLLLEGVRLSAAIESGDKEKAISLVGAMQEIASTDVEKGADVASAADEVDRTFRDALEGRPDMRRMFPLPVVTWDSMLGPLYEGEFVLVAARPSVGKTSFCVQMATECCRAGFNVVYIATEASAVQVVSQMASQWARVDLRNLANELPENLKKASQMTQSIKASKKLKIFDRDITINAIEARCRMLADWADVVFIDHLAQIQNPGKSRYESVSDTCHRMVGIKKRLKGPLVLAHQLKRIEDNNVPSLQDLRDSGAAEEDASRILLIHFPNDNHHGIPQVGLNIDPPATRDYYVIQAKHRYGPRDVSVRCRYHAPTTRFLPLT